MTTDTRTAYLAAEGFEPQLIDELQHVQSVHGRLVITSTAPQKAAWAENVWRNIQEIEISSISDGAKKLRQNRGQRWALYSHDWHRRASLIQAELPAAVQKPIDFLCKDLPPKPASWTLLSENRIVYSVDCTSHFTNNEIQFNEKKNGPPSRAYLKLWEVFTVNGFQPEPGQLCLDLGASPGGWTWVLSELRCRVKAFDRSPLASDLMRKPNVEFSRANAFALKPEEIGRVDWLFSDVICEPAHLEKLIHTWIESGLCRNFVCTLKFKGQTDREVAGRLSQIPAANLQHLHHNKHELTFWLLASQSS